MRKYRKLTEFEKNKLESKQKELLEKEKIRGLNRRELNELEVIEEKLK